MQDESSVDAKIGRALMSQQKELYLVLQNSIEEQRKGTEELTRELKDQLSEIRESITGKDFSQSRKLKAKGVATPTTPKVGTTAKAGSAKVGTTAKGTTACSVEYVVSTAVATWTQHQIIARSIGCELASISSAAESAEVAAAAAALTPPPTTGFWIGGRRLASITNLDPTSQVGGWRWSDGSGWTFITPFSVNLNTDNRVVFLSATQWTSDSGSVPRPAIYECCIPSTAPFGIQANEGLANALQALFAFLNVPLGALIRD
jgi:hypothetical protein